MHVNLKSKGDSQRRATAEPKAKRSITFRTVHPSRNTSEMPHKIMTRDEHGRRVDRTGALRSKTYSYEGRR